VAITRSVLGATRVAGDGALDGVGSGGNADAASANVLSEVAVVVEEVVAESTTASALLLLLLLLLLLACGPATDLGESGAGVVNAVFNVIVMERLMPFVLGAGVLALFSLAVAVLGVEGLKVADAAMDGVAAAERAGNSSSLSKAIGLPDGLD
jgi:hypothetical protein